MSFPVPARSSALVSIALMLLAGSERSYAAQPVDAKLREQLTRAPRTENRLEVSDPLGGSLEGSGLADALVGSVGKDILKGGSGTDALIGDAGDDELLSGDHDDYLDGGRGRDLLLGGSGDDRYKFSPGDGVDRVNDAVGDNLIILTGFTKKTQLTVERKDVEYIISYGDGDRVQLNESTFSTARFLIAGQLFEREELLQSYGVGSIGYPRVSSSPSGKRELRAGPMPGQIRGTSADEILLGGPAEDYLFGDGGNDEFRTGSPGGAIMSGGKGNDTYIVETAIGRALISDKGGVDVLKITSPLTLDRLVFREMPATLLITFLQPGDSAPGEKDIHRWNVSLVDWGQSADSVIETVELHDGRRLTADEVEALIVGNRRPRLTRNLGDQHARVGKPFEFKVPDDLFVDPEGKPLELRLGTSRGLFLPEWLKHRGDRTTVGGTPTAADRATVEMEITATDVGQLHGRAIFRIVVE